MSEDDENLTLDDNINYKSITCENIPEVFLDKLVAKHYFSKFGRIKRFILRPKRFSCTVEYESENDADDAVVNACFYNGEYFKVRYTQNEVAHAKNTEEWVDPDVQAELDTMRPQARLGPPVGTTKATLAPKVPKSILKTRAVGVEGLVKIADNGLRSELEAALKRQALDNEEKFRILEARDKLLRLTNIRTTDIRRVESIKGFCPDMCPEKERLLRENRNQIAIFELEANENRMDHKLAVKEYSRSSADQETPLPHELRPEPVLKLTMTYLMFKIMDLCDSEDVNIADWYHFIWDRTRSIRKDITQQELCSLATVELVEQCARFHIHCAARLVAEDSLVFDQKINTENLTKCLQTLKYMYHDLRLQNKKCPNEAEFRSYVILLNLNDSNFLWEVKQLPDEIQNSKEVRFALATYIAMESNNYVRFFNLAREATYMNGCILLRYFTQVRIRAIRAIMVAYKWPLHVISIPVQYIRDILGFESNETTCMFLEHHGLECDGEKVNLDKKAFHIPEMPFPMERALLLIEGKKTCTAGEAVCGRPLDSIDALAKYVPHSSFDDRGFLKPESWNAQDQQKDGEAKKKTTMNSDGLFKVPSASPPISPRFKSPSPNLKVPSESAKSHIFQPITKPSNQKPPLENTTTTLISRDTPKSGGTLFSLPVFNKPVQGALPQPISKSIFGGVNNVQESIKAPLLSISKPQITDTQIKYAAPLTLRISESKVNEVGGFSFNSFQHKAPALDILKQASESGSQTEAFSSDEESTEPRSEDEEQEHIKKRQELERIEQEKQRHQEINAKRRQNLQEIEERSDSILSSFLDQEMILLINETANVELTKYRALNSSSEEICSLVIEQTIHEILEDVIKEEFSVIVTHKTILEKYFSLWRTYVRRTLEHRKLMESTPIWICDQSVTDAHPQQAQSLEMKERYLLGVSKKFHIKSKEEMPIDIFKPFLHEMRSRVPALTYRCLLRTRKYFKYVVSLPHEEDELKGFNSFMSSWLDKHIKRRKLQQQEEFFSESKENISICLRKVEGISPKNESGKRVADECDNANGVIFIMSSTNFLNSRKRLQYLLKLSAMCVKVPLAVVIYNSTVEEDFIEEELHLQKLIDDNRIQYYSLFPSTVFKNNNNLREAFQEVFTFLARYTNQSDELEMQGLCAFLRTTLGDEFWKRLGDSSLVNPSFRKICTQPDRIVTLYNEAIDILIHMLEANFEELPEFPRELRKFVPNVSLDIPLGIEHFPANWKDTARNKAIQHFLKGLKLQSMPALSGDLNEIEHSLLKYCTACISSESYAKRAGYTAIKHFLQNVHKPELLTQPIAERCKVISWLEVVQSVALELLTFAWHTKHIALPKEIIYKRLPFKEYTSVPWWYDGVTLKSIKMEADCDEPENSEVDHSPPSAKKSKTEIDTLLQRSTALLERADRNIAQFKAITSKSREISRPLDEKLYQRELFNRKLKRSVQNSLRESV